MPYITKNRQMNLETRLAVSSSEDVAGDLNYMITMLIQDYMMEKGKSYQTINEIIGVLECAKLEFYRRVASPYEDGKRLTNGDVYGCSE